MQKGRIENLKPQAHKLTVEEQSAGGKKSAEVRKQKKTIQNLLKDYLDSDCKSSPQLKKLAAQMGLKNEDSIKQVFTIACVLNTLKRGSLQDLQLLQSLLGENAANVGNVAEDDPLTKSLREVAKEMEKDAER